MQYVTMAVSDPQLYPFFPKWNLKAEAFHSPTAVDCVDLDYVIHIAKRSKPSHSMYVVWFFKAIQEIKHMPTIIKGFHDFSHLNPRNGINQEI